MSNASRRPALVGALVGLGAGTLLLLLIIAWAGGPSALADGEKKAFALTVAMLGGLPLSLVVNVIARALAGSEAFRVVYLLLIVAVPINWAIVGACVGKIVQVVGRRRA